MTRPRFVNLLKACQGGTIVYFKCDDCAAEAARVEPAGGRIHKPKLSIGQYGFIALALDPEDWGTPGYSVSERRRVAIISA